MRAYYGNRISPNMTKTPEGFLICHNVPIARTGWQRYLPQEIGVEGSEILQVLRSEEEVFAAATLASFEGKPVTDNHPPVGVDACNYAAYTKGAVQNVRRGSGAYEDCLLADLVVHDAVLAAEIDAGKREISCGYDCIYEKQKGGTYKQTRIVGNHVAVVKSGRAGHRVSIQDEKPKEEKTKMKKGSIFDRMFSAFVKDAEPEEIKEAADAINSVKEEAPPEKKAEENKEPTTDTAARLLQMDARIANIEKLLTKDEEAKEEKTALDALEEELKKADDAEEQSVTVPAEEVKDEAAEEEKHAADSAPLLAVIRAMKPVVAALPKEQRKSVSDAMGKAVRDAMAVKPTQPAEYAAMAKRKVADAAPEDKRAFGEACQKRNPHYKEER